MDFQKETTNILKRVKALITDSHLVGTSGRHMSVYINKDAIYPHTKESSEVGKLFAELNKDLNIDAVIGPALGGIVLSQWTAYHLSQMKGKEVLGLYSEKTENNNQVLKRGYDKLVGDKNILVVEDLTTTGSSVRKLVDSVKAAGGRVLQVSVIANRDPKLVTADVVGAPFNWLAVIPAESYEEADCPLCKSGVPINAEVGHGTKYLEAKANAKI